MVGKGAGRMRGKARDSILSGIRAALAETSPDTPASHPAEKGGTEPPRMKPDPISRRYRRSGSRSRTEILELFVERVADYRATVVRCGFSELPESVARALRRGGVRRLVVPADLPSSWLDAVPGGGVDVLRDGEGGDTFSKARIASCDGVLTGCALGIAETGTIVLDAGPAQGRRALTLLPDYHLCVVLAEQVVETVPESTTKLAAVVKTLRRPLTLISGPSATSDIELVRVEGVHGPRNLEVILVEEAP
jgi:L-lactate dehydrogenase complex protein LldG